MRAILEMISSISCLPMVFFCFDFGRMRCAAPASSSTSMALSGKWRSLMKRAESSAALVIAAALNLTLWCLLEARLQSLEYFDGLLNGRFGYVDLLETTRQCMVLFEHAAIFLISGRADALQLPVRQRRLSRLEASIVPPEAAPAPIIVWISSMNNIEPCLSLSSFNTAFRALARSRRDTWCRPAASPCRAQTHARP